MQLPVVLNNVLSERFLGNEEVFNHADEQGELVLMESSGLQN